MPTIINPTFNDLGLTNHTQPTELVSSPAVVFPATLYSVPLQLVIFSSVRAFKSISSLSVVTADFDYCTNVDLGVGSATWINVFHAQVNSGASGTSTDIASPRVITLPSPLRIDKVSVRLRSGITFSATGCESDVFSTHYYILAGANVVGKGIIGGFIG